jgi:hypothetical protein
LRRDASSSVAPSVAAHPSRLLLWPTCTNVQDFSRRANTGGTGEFSPGRTYRANLPGEFRPYSPVPNRPCAGERLGDRLGDRLGEIASFLI